MATTPLYVLAGQSNALFLNWSGEFAAALAERGVGETVITSAEVGRPLAASDTLTDYYPFEDGDDTTGELYHQLVERIQLTLASDDDLYLAGIFWLQGEEDAKSATDAAAYYDNLHQLQFNLVAEFGDGFDFVLNVLPSYIGASHLAGWDDVQAAQVQLAEVHDRTYLVSSDVLIEEQGYLKSEVYRDNFHYTDLTYAYLADSFLDLFPTNPGLSHQVGSVGAGIAARDDATGLGYLMYSATALAERMPLVETADTADQLVAVVYDEATDSWYYDTDTALVAFTPEATDVLLAAVDFSTDKVTDLKGTFVRVGGVVAGYVDGNLAFHADQFDGMADDGEFGVDGNWFEHYDTENLPEVETRYVSVSREYTPGTMEAEALEPAASGLYHADAGDWLIG